MVYQMSPIGNPRKSHRPATTTQWIESWQNRLLEVVDHVQPWTLACGGIPAWVRSRPAILELVEFMESRVNRLAGIVSQQSARPVDSWTIAYIEHELNELLHVAKTFDDSLRRIRGGSAPEELSASDDSSMLRFSASVA